MVVYSRSEKGQLASYGEQSALPRKLKSLLRVIDGKTTLDVYVRNLHAFGDVENVLLSLEMAGLLQHSGNAVAIVPAQLADLPVASGWRKLLSFRSADASSVPVDEHDHAVIEPQSFSGFGETVMHSGFRPSLSNQNSIVKQATSEMADFILTHAPEHAFMVLKELEEISSADQLAMAMGGYAQVIERNGEIGTRHLDKINQLLRNIL